MLAGRLKDTLALWAYSSLKFPLLAILRPRIEHLDHERSVVRVVMSHLTRNHLGSMYFGAICMGAELCPGLMAMRHIEKKGNLVNLVFKEFHARFLKRVEGDAVFTCTQGAELARMVDETLETGERVEKTVKVITTVPDRSGDEPVAEFDLTISVKRRKR